MKNYSNNKIYMVLALMGMLFMGCSKMDDPVAGYIKGGEIIYSTRVDSLKAFPGNKRIKLSWLLPANHSAVKAIVYWNNRAESKELPLVKGNNNTYEYILDNMPEASYLFSLYTFDKNGNQSIKSELSTVAYGDKYRQGLLNRVYIKLSKVSASGSLLINWALAERSQAAVEVEYTNLSGSKLVSVTPAASNETTIASIDFTKPIRYRTIYNPDLKSIDNFPSDWSVNIDISKL